MGDTAKKAWVVAVNMGYGHQRTAFPLREMALGNEVINANDYLGIPEKDKVVWKSTRSFYEFISRFKRIPIVGQFAFSLYDKFQKIPSYYPKRDLSKPNFGMINIHKLMKRGWGGDLISRLNKQKIPFVSTFFISAFMAEFFGYEGDIYCIICDADVSRSWASLDPAKSRIKYFAPNSWVADRLALYGVREESIFLTGYPLPKENIGSKKEILINDLKERLINLDPFGDYREKYKSLVDSYLGELPKGKPSRPMTIMFSVGGAGAQKEIAAKYLENLSTEIKKGKIRIFLGAGARKEVRDYFFDILKSLELESAIGRGVDVVFSETTNDYFSLFNKKLRETDILWTKPSELSFYSGLGLPIIMAPSIGSQEDFNRKWLLRIGAGIPQEDPKYASQWIFDYLESGRFAEAAMHGLIEEENMGSYNIEKIVFGEL